MSFEEKLTQANKEVSKMLSVHEKIFLIDKAMRHKDPEKEIRRLITLYLTLNERVWHQCLLIKESNGRELGEWNFKS